MQEFDTTTIIGKIEAAIAFSERSMPQSCSELVAQVETEVEQLQAENKELKKKLLDEQIKYSSTADALHKNIKSSYKQKKLHKNQNSIDTPT